MNRIITYMTVGMVLVGCGGEQSPPTSYPGVVMSKRFEKQDPVVTYDPLLPGAFKIRPEYVPDRYFVKIRFCKPDSLSDCKEAEQEVAKDIYDALNPSDKIAYTNGEIKLP